MTQNAGGEASTAADETIVEFRMPADHVDATTVHLVGEFNHWSKVATPMQRSGSQFVVSVPLANGRTYRYKFLVDGEQWENDWNADAYVSNEYGGDDSVLDLTKLPRTAAERVDPDSPGAAIDDLNGEIPEPNEPA